MIVISDSSPLIALARVDCLELLPHLFPIVQIPSEVHNEVVIAGSGLPGSAEVARARWVQVTGVHETMKLQIEMEATGLGPGEIAVVQLAREVNTDVVLIDEWKARRYAEDARPTNGC